MDVFSYRNLRVYQGALQLVTSIYNKLGIKELCKNKIRSYYNEAHDLLNNISFLEDKKKVLWDYVASMIDRSF